MIAVRTLEYFHDLGVNLRHQLEVVFRVRPDGVIQHLGEYFLS
jgi:hypothetical protein